MSATVLVVEDEVDLLFTIALSLELSGYRVIKAASGEEALTLVEKERPDAVVLDIRLPGIDGWSVLEAIKAEPETRDIPVIVVSIVDERARGAALGAAEYLVKPVRRDDLLAALAAVTTSGGRRRHNDGLEGDAP